MAQSCAEDSLRFVFAPPVVISSGIEATVTVLTRISNTILHVSTVFMWITFPVITFIFP